MASLSLWSSATLASLLNNEKLDWLEPYGVALAPATSMLAVRLTCILTCVFPGRFTPKDCLLVE